MVRNLETTVGYRAKPCLKTKREVKGERKREVEKM